ncbi:hypothetical protein U9K52_09835 [Chryseobacterium sp. MHB01]|uniref:hypothetical protein n=1 Tax=Chryseobacterium sp. MHB01 TaxID=3109433 RepID=UPI002AFE53AF|nr:hypothetical protein [Chryseobacterium sp. MHB01]MEA1849212.1 hypothetical protein [Chryseobacterium sp. MHB01]
MELVKAKHKQTGGCNGLSFSDLDEQINAEYSEIKKVFEKLLAEKKIVYLNHLNGRSLSLPK